MNHTRFTMLFALLFTILCTLSSATHAQGAGFGFPPPTGEVVEVKDVRVYTIDILIEEQHLQLTEEDVLVKDIPYGNIRTTGAIIQVQSSPGAFGSAQWFPISNIEGVVLMSNSIQLPIGYWVSRGLKPGYRVRVVIITGR